MNALPDLTAIALARNEYESRNIAVEAVKTKEYPHFRAFSEVQYPERSREQFVFRDLKQLVPWKRIENVLQSLAIVAGRQQSRSRHHLRGFQPQQRDFPGQFAIGN